MKAKMRGLLTVALLAGPMATNAAVVTWEAQGSITSASGAAPGFGSVLAGDHFVISWSFDTGAPLVIANTGGIYSPGVRYDHGAASLVMSVMIGASGPITFSFSPTAPPSSTFNKILLRDDSGDVPVNGNPADGISFGLLYDDSSFLGLIFRTDDLAVVTGPGLPANPYLGMADFPVSAFQYGGNEWFFLGDVTSVSRISVPEPGTLALLGLGLTSLALSRKRKSV